MQATHDRTETLQLRDAVIEARNDYYSGRGTEAAMNEATDAYIAAIKRFYASKGLRKSPPSRAYLLRAL